MSLYVHFENTSQGPIYLLTVDLGDSTASFAETTVYIQLSTPVNEALLAQYFRGGETVPREITILDVAW